MKSFDTNVAVRLIVEDDPEQCERAANAFRQGVVDGGVFFSATVLVEVAWVLRVAYRQDRTAIVAALRRFVGTVGVTVEHDAVVRRAIDAFEVGQADFSDDFIRELSRESGSLPVITFDKRFARDADVELVPSR